MAFIGKSAGFTNIGTAYMWQTDKFGLSKLALRVHGQSFVLLQVIQMGSVSSLII